MKKNRSIISWVLRLIAAIILLQTLYYKFGGAPESVHIFTVLGVEPWGRIGLGVFELITAILLLIPSTVWIGAGLGIGLMLGAIGAHVTLLGIEVQGDGGTLFLLALVTLIASASLLMLHKEQLRVGLSRLLKRDV